SNVLGSLVSIPFAQGIGTVAPADLGILAMFGVLQVGLGLSLFTFGSRFLPSGQASLIATLETPMMPFWVWLAFGEVPSARALVGGALVMGAVVADILADTRAREGDAAAKAVTSGEKLFLGLGREQERIALGATGVGGACRLGLGDVLGEHRDHADAEPVCGDHHLVGLVVGHAEFALEHGDDEFARGVIVVDQDHLVQPWPLDLGLDP